MSSPVNIEKLLKSQNASTRHFNANESLFIEGEDYTGLYYIKNGNVKVTRNAKNKMAVWFANPFQFVGLSSFFDETGNYSFSTFAFGGSVETLYISPKDFNSLVNNHPAFKKEVIRILCRRIIKIRDKVSTVKSQNIKQRFINSLLLLISKEEANTSQIKISYSVDELSELTATSKQYIKKLIIEFHKKNLYEIQGDSLIINMNELNTYLI